MFICIADSKRSDQTLWIHANLDIFICFCIMLWHLSVMYFDVEIVTVKILEIGTPKIITLIVLTRNSLV